MSGGSVFVGRDRDLGEIRAALDDARDGRGRALLLSGEAGIGKSRLAEEAAVLARDAGFAVLRGACWEGGGAPALWPWVQVLRDASALGEVPDLMRRDHDEFEAGDAARFRLFDDVSLSLNDLSERSPLLMVLEDLHWADAESLLLLRFVVRGARASSVVVLGSVRDTDVDDDAAALLAGLGSDVRRVELGGLDAGSVAALAASISGTTPSASFAASLHAQTGGNPLFVEEVVRLMATQKHPGDAAAPPLPGGVRDVLRRRLARLSQPCIDVLAAAAVLGQSFATDRVAAIAGIDAAAAGEHLDEAERARVVVASGPGRFDFSHALFRETLLAGLAAGRRVVLHEAAADAIEAAPDAGGHAADIARHRLAALMPATARRAAEAARRAGDASLRALGYERAAGFYRDALLALDQAPAGEPADELRLSLLLSFGDASLRAGDVPAATDAFVRAAAIARTAGDAHALADAALGYSGGTGFEVRLLDATQVGLLEEALAALGETGSARVAWLKARLSVALTFRADEDRRAALAREAVAVAAAAGDGAAHCYALSAVCDAIAGPQFNDERLAAADEMIRICASNGGLAEAELLARRFRLVALLERGDFAAADVEIETFARLSDQVRQPAFSFYPQLWRGARAAMAGRFSETGDLIEEVARIGRVAHSDNAFLMAATLFIGLHWWRGTLSPGSVMDGMPFAEMFAELVRRTEGMPAAMPAVAMAAIAMDRPDQATTALDRLAAEAATLPRDSEWTTVLFAGVEAARAAGHDTAAKHLLELMRPWAGRWAVDGIGGFVWGPMSLACSHAATMAGAFDEAESYARDALAASEAAGSSPLVALAQQALAEALHARGGDRAEVAELAGAALRVAESLGMAPLQAAASALAGSHPPATVASAATREGVFRRDGEIFTLAWQGKEIRMKDSKGLRDLARLLAAPGREIHVADLVSEAAAAPRAPREAADVGGIEGDAGELVDRQARAAYTARIADLREDLDEAETMGDTGRIARIRAEIEFIESELAAAFGLGGRVRKAGDPVEKARKAVTGRIRDAIRKAGEEHPALGRHLDRSVRTGVFCSYDPPDPVTWAL